MKPADLTTHVRQRSPWEAIDLGFMLVQQNARTLFPSWMVLLILVAVPIWLLMPEGYKWTCGIVVWWLKPVYDRLLLHILSHSLFARKLSTAEVLSALPGLLRRNGLLSGLTYRRLSFSRSYDLPVWQLEGLQGAERKQRQNLLHLQGRSQAVWLTFACANLEWIIILSLYALVLLLDPTGQSWEHVKSLFSADSSLENQYWQELIDYMFYLLAIGVLEPFYVAAGFSLYLNRRTQLEAWDIEIAFRSIGERLHGMMQRAQQQSQQAQPTLPALLLACLLVLGLSSTPGTVQAADSSERSEYQPAERQPVSVAPQMMTEVMAADELAQRRKITTWIARDNSKKQDDPFQMADGAIQLLSQALKGLLWVAVLVGLVLAFVYRHKILALLTPRRQKAPLAEKPQVLFGMDIRPESLPADIAASARALWQAGQIRETLSLLYRGALMLLTRAEDIRIHDGHTEGDILRLAQPVLTEERFAYLRNITRHWQAIAYAHREPDAAAIEALLQQWPEFQRSQHSEHSQQLLSALDNKPATAKVAA